MTSVPQTSRPAIVRCIFCGTANRVDLAKLAAGPKCAECGRPIRLDRPLKVTDMDFEQTVNGSSVTVVVDFYADWCGPCKMMAPSVDQLAANFVGRAVVAKLDTDAAQKTAGSFQIRGIPTTIVFRGGQEVSRQSGAVPYGRLAAMIDDIAQAS